MGHCPSASSAVPLYPLNLQPGYRPCSAKSDLQRSPRRTRRTAEKGTKASRHADRASGPAAPGRTRPAKGAAAGTAFLGIFRDFRERNLTAENTENAEENRQGVAEKKGSSGIPGMILGHALAGIPVHPIDPRHAFAFWDGMPGRRFNNKRIWTGIKTDERG